MVTVHLLPTPGQGAVHARMTVNRRAAHALGKIHKEMAGRSYEADPERYEQDVAYHFVYRLPTLVSAINYAMANNAIIIEVLGLPGPEKPPLTPEDGCVVEAKVGEHVVNLVGTFAGASGLRGFSYVGENDGLMLRPVLPKRETASQASSQGFANDLDMHMDNADRTIPQTFDSARSDRGPMNSYQAFATVRECPHTPMEIAALQDIVNEAIEAHGNNLIDVLKQSDFAVRKPDSHGGGEALKGVPVLVKDSDGRMHGRFHMANVTGLTTQAEDALKKFRKVVAEAGSIVRIQGRPNGLILYSNTQCMHRRSRYIPRFDGSDRFYLRLYLSSFGVMTAYGAHANGRVFN
tara:strand:- start:6669 stop:7715 length:1047 start_codon:yes stop_codon:yes gene_type:complete